MFLPDVKRCRFCQCPSQSDLCETCFPVWSELEECGSFEPEESERVEGGADPGVEEFVFESVCSVMLRLADFLKCPAGLVDRARWCEELGPLFCTLGGCDVFDSQADFFETFHSRFFGIVVWFMQSITEEEKKSLWESRKVSWRLVAVKKLVEARIAARAATVARQGIAPGVVAEKLEERSRAPRLPKCFEQPKEPSEWVSLRACAQCVLEVMVTRSWVAPVSGVRYFDRGVKWLCVVTGYGSAQVKRAMRELRDAGFIVSVAPAKERKRCRKYRVTRSLDDLRASRAGG